MSLPSVEAVTSGFTGESLRQSAPKKELSPGLYQWAIQNATIRVVEKGSLAGHFEINLRVAPINANGVAEVGATQWSSVKLPFVNPTIPGHTVNSKIAGMSGVFAAAIRPDTCGRPVKDQQTQQYVLGGRVLASKEEINKAFEESRDRVAAQLKAWYTEGASNEEGTVTSLKDETFYGALAQNGEYLNMDMFNLAAEAPAGAKVLRTI